jgi:ribonuclease HII
MVTVGIDEVGRGCWAGPVVAGAVILSGPIEGLKDSKLLSKKQRNKLASDIEISAIAIGLGWTTPAELDRLGLTAAVALAMQRALDQIVVNYDEIIIDGSYNFLKDNMKAKAIIKADNSVPSVSAASIYAKVARDSYMSKQALHYPSYGFAEHVGYGTMQHQKNLRLYGICDLHRRSFKPIKALLQLTP